MHVASGKLSIEQWKQERVTWGGSTIIFGRGVGVHHLNHINMKYREVNMFEKYLRK